MLRLPDIYLKDKGENVEVHLMTDKAEEIDLKSLNINP